MMTIICEEYGEGTPVILIHGFAADNTIWKAVAEALKQVYILCPNLPCIQGSEGEAENISLEYAALQIKQLMDTKNISQALVIGHSMGGYIAQTFAQLYPEKIAGIGLLHSTPLADTDEKKNNRKKAANFILEKGRAKFLQMAIPNWMATENRIQYAHEIDRLIDTAMHLEDKVLYQYQMAIAERENSKQWFENWDKPKLLVLGKNDELIPYQEHEYLQTDSRLQLHFISHCGHTSMIEQKTQLVDILQQWIQKN